MLRVKNWGKFQHFKDRRPPWIKLYRDILDDREWHNLDPAASKYLVMLWLIASEDDGNLPPVPDIAFRLRMSEDKVNSYLSKLSHWLIQDDIKAISPCHHDDAPETETETETETENTPPTPTAVKMPHVDIPPDWRQQAMTEKGWPEHVVLDVWANFRDYWTTGKGKNTKRSDWAASWRTWFRKENINMKGTQHGKQPTQDERARAAVHRAAVAGGFAPEGFSGS